MKEAASCCFPTTPILFWSGRNFKANKCINVDTNESWPTAAGLIDYSLFIIRFDYTSDAVPLSHNYQPKLSIVRPCGTETLLWGAQNTIGLEGGNKLLIDWSWILDVMGLFKTAIMVVEYIFPSIAIVACQYVGWPGIRNRAKLMIAIVAITFFYKYPQWLRKPTRNLTS